MDFTFRKLVFPKMSLLITLTAVCAVLGVGAQQTPPMLDGRIIGGVDVDIAEYPYQVSFMYHGSHICGGSIISDKYVVTAAHCTEELTTEKISVRVGSSYRTHGGDIIRVSKIHQHELYNRKTMEYDISVLELEEKLTFKRGINKIDLVEAGEVTMPGSQAICTGWGSISTEETLLPSILKQVQVPVVGKHLCQYAYGRVHISETMMCAGKGKKDACQGDSGGPLVYDGKLIGIVSWGYGCADPQYPGVYSDVSALRSFIKDITHL